MEIINGTNIAVEIRNQLKMKNEQAKVSPNLGIFWLEMTKTACFMWV